MGRSEGIQQRAGARQQARRWGARLAWVAGLVAALGGCKSSDAATGCVNDGGCAGDLVCDTALGQCVAPAGGQAGASGAAGKGGNSSLQNDSVASDAPCTVRPQSGCPAGHACLVANPSGATSCYSAGALTLGARCSSLNDCAVGLLCAYGQCRPICATAADCPSKPYGECYPFTVDAAMTPLPKFGFCSLQCNPADPTNAAKAADFASCLPTASTCAPSSNTTEGSTECYQAGNQDEGEPCSTVSDCAGGLTCLRTSAGSANGQCTALCLVGKGGCHSGSCQSFNEKQYVGAKGALLEVGACY